MKDNSIIGSWGLIQSEVSTIEPKSEIFQFIKNGRFNMCYPNGITKLFYLLEEDVIRFGDRRKMFHKMGVSFEGDVMIILGSHGMESYYRKLTKEELPDWADDTAILKSNDIS